MNDVKNRVCATSRALACLIFMGDDYCPSGDCLILKAVYYDGYIDQTVTDFGWRFSPGENGEWYIEDFTELSNMGDHI